MGSRKIRIVSRRRKQPDFRKLSRALLELAAAQAEAEAQAEHESGGVSSARKKQLRGRPHAE